jgi:excisionase family DNA binding protein
VQGNAKAHCPEATATEVEGVAAVNAHAALPFCDLHGSPVSQVGTAGYSDVRLAKGAAMGKISIVSRRRRDKRFPETNAQRRARVRELSPTDSPSSFQTGSADALPEQDAVVEYSTALLDDLVAATGPAMTSDLEGLADGLTELFLTEGDTAVRIELTPEQSQAITALSLLTTAQNQPLMLDLREWHEQQRIVLQFSLHADTVPEMLSVKDLCQQLKVGRRSVMRLIREGRLRCYRIGKRYRFVASEVKQYLEQSSSQES